jgi:hypothetical protein
MKRAAGLWIDHRKALIVFISDDGEESKEIESDIEKHTRFSGGSRSEQGRGEDQQDRQYSGHLDVYYDEVIAQLRDAMNQLSPAFWCIPAAEMAQHLGTGKEGLSSEEARQRLVHYRSNLLS